MLVLSRRMNEKLHLGDNITISVVKVTGGRVRLAIDAPKDTKISRGELKSGKRDQQVDTTSG